MKIESWVEYLLKNKKGVYMIIITKKCGLAPHKYEDICKVCY